MGEAGQTKQHRSLGVHRSPKGDSRGNYCHQGNTSSERNTWSPLLLLSASLKATAHAETLPQAELQKFGDWGVLHAEPSSQNKHTTAQSSILHRHRGCRALHACQTSVCPRRGVVGTQLLFSLCCLCLPTCLTWDLSAAFLWVTTICVWGRCGSTTSPGGNDRLLTSISQRWSVHGLSITRASPAATLAKKLPQHTWGFKAAGEEAGDCATATWRCRRLGWERADPLGHLAEDAASDSQGREIPLLLHTALLRKLREGKKKRKMDFKAF